MGTFEFSRTPMNVLWNEIFLRMRKQKTLSYKEKSIFKGSHHLQTICYLWNANADDFLAPFVGSFCVAFLCQEVICEVIGKLQYCAVIAFSLVIYVTWKFNNNFSNQQ